MTIMNGWKRCTAIKIMYFTETLFSSFHPVTCKLTLLLFKKDFVLSFGQLKLYKLRNFCQLNECNNYILYFIDSESGFINRYYAANNNW